jgi:hypothetical protein
LRWRLIVENADGDSIVLDPFPVADTPNPTPLPLLARVPVAALQHLDEQGKLEIYFAQIGGEKAVFLRGSSKDIVKAQLDEIMRNPLLRNWYLVPQHSGRHWLDWERIQEWVVGLIHARLRNEEYQGKKPKNAPKFDYIMYREGKERNDQRMIAKSEARPWARPGEGLSHLPAYIGSGVGLWMPQQL